jgi:hypothetical protein
MLNGMFGWGARKDGYPRRVLQIYGDHSRFHCGSAAVFRSLVSIARSNGWTVTRRDGAYDALVVNGEGTMHHGSKGFHRKMKMLAEAVAANKPAYLVNSVWQENPDDYDDVLRQLSGLMLREVRSRDDMWARHGIRARVVPDASIFDQLRPVFRRMNFRGRPAMTDFFFPGEREHFRRADDLFPGVRFLPFLRMSWSGTVASIKTAEFLITGRHHGVYAACRARVPFAASEGNTHKIRGLMESAGVNVPVANHPSEVPALIPQIKERRAEFEKLFNWLEAQDYRSIIPPAAG